MPKRAACHPWLDCQLHVRRGECPPSFALTLSFDGFDQIMGCRAEICRFAFGFFFVQSRRRSSKKGPQRTCNVSSSKKHSRCRKNRESTQSFIGNSNYSIGGPDHDPRPRPRPHPDPATARPTRVEARPSRPTSSCLKVKQFLSGYKQGKLTFSLLTEGMLTKVSSQQRLSTCLLLR